MTPKPRKKRVFRHLRQQLNEIDYKHKLSDTDKEWITKFYHEYYQADFDENPVHPTEFKKECARRNNEAYRQLHNIGGDLLDQALDKIYKAQGTSQSHRYYSPHDYSTFHEKADEDESDTEILEFFKEPLQDSED